MKNPFLYLFLCIAWIFAGAWMWSNASCCNISNPLSVKDGATTVAAHTTGNLRFATASAALIDPPEDIKSELKNLATHLKATPGKTFSITGFYDNDNENESIGLGRADAIKAHLVGLGAAGSQILTGGALRNGLIVDNGEAIGPWTYGFDSRGISIQDGDKFDASNLNNFVFEKSGFIHATSTSENPNGVNKVMSETAEYLKKNPNRALKITGLYHEDETYAGILPNLGMARASNIKELLQGMDVNAGQINLDSRMDKGLAFDFDSNKLWSGLNFEFAGKANSEKDLAAIRARLQAKPITLYFKTNDASLELSAEQRNDIADIIYYLDRTPNGKLTSSGHTDDRGDYSLNKRLSRKRAEFVQDYFGKNGISASKIEATGFGPDKPIGDNTTDEGRQKNRRVEITIK